MNVGIKKCGVMCVGEKYTTFYCSGVTYASEQGNITGTSNGEGPLSLQQGARAIIAVDLLRQA